MSDMANDHGPVVQSALLCDELVRLRRDAGLTQDQVAVALAWTTEHVIRIEGGRPVAEADLDALLRRYAVPAARQERLRELNRGTSDERWWAGYRDDVPAAYLEYIGYERGAASIRQFPGTVVPGLLQTAAYARALTDIALDDPARAARVVALRRRRQSELADRDTPPRQHYILDEAVIRRRIGASRDQAIMAGQLRHIAGLAGAGEQVTVQVIPFAAGEHSGLSGPFTLLELTGGLPDIVYLDPGRDPIEMISRPDRVADYACRFERLRAVALPMAESLDLIRAAAGDVP
jgi:transcriptional regulator with XRE-family HTH domain